MTSLSTAATMLPGLVVGLTLHEFAHAWSASLLGDDFARRQGRVSLNPLRHLSPLGTLALLLLPFGWGKPVVVNLYNFRHPKRDYLITSLAGPLANVVVAVLAMGLMQLTRHTYSQGPLGAPYLGSAYSVLMLMALVNVILATVNLIPIPPLDGSKIWPCLVPGLKPAVKRKTTWLFVGVLVLLMYSGGIDRAAGFVLEGAMSIMPVSDERVFRHHAQAGWRELGAKQFPQAEQSFTRAIEANPFSGDCLRGRALAREWQGNWDGAMADANRAIEMDGSRPESYEYRARALDAIGRPDDAQRDRAQAQALRGAMTPHSGPASEPASRSSPSF